MNYHYFTTDRHKHQFCYKNCTIFNGCRYIGVAIPMDYTFQRHGNIVCTKQTAPKAECAKLHCFGGIFMHCGGWAGHCCLSGQGYNRCWYGRGRQAGSVPRWGYPACRSRNWNSRPVYISDTPQHPFAADHDPPADPGYVDTWYLPQRLYSR